VALAKAVGKQDAVRAPLGSDPGDDGDGDGDDDPDYDTAVGRA
jgi:hypothetical protein